MRFRSLILFAILSLLLPQQTVAEPIGITSASPYQLAELLEMETPAYDLDISGDLVYPRNPQHAMPAFIFMHGSGGMLLRHQSYLELARELGFVTLQIDSFGPRNVSSTVGNQTNVTAAMMATDALRALKYLAEQPNVDPEKIVIMGSSKGAIAALFSTWNPIRQKIVGNFDFAGYMLLYPLCVDIEDGNVTEKPVRVFIGNKDNWTPAQPCIEQVERMKALGRDWSITLYQDAYHGFDAPIEGIRSMPHAYSMAECAIALRSDGYEYETGSGFLLTKAERSRAFRACATKGSVKMGGYHAFEALLKDVGDFLEKVAN